MSIIFLVAIAVLSIIICAISLAAGCCHIIDHYDDGWKGALHVGTILVTLFLSIWLCFWLVNNTSEVRCSKCQTEWTYSYNDSNYCHVCGTKLERRN